MGKKLLKTLSKSTIPQQVNKIIKISSKNKLISPIPSSNSRPTSKTKTPNNLIPLKTKSKSPQAPSHITKKKSILSGPNHNRRKAPITSNFDSTKNASNQMKKQENIKNLQDSKPVELLKITKLEPDTPIKSNFKNIEVENVEKRARLKRNSNKLSTAAPVEESSENLIKSKKYDVERIIEKQLFGNCFKYLIKWEGFESEYNTWEPRKYLPRHMIEEFEKKNRGFQVQKSKPQELQISSIKEDIINKTLIITDELNLQIEDNKIGKADMATIQLSKNPENNENVSLEDQESKSIEIEEIFNKKPENIPIDIENPIITENLIRPIKKNPPRKVQTIKTQAKKPEIIKEVLDIEEEEKEPIDINGGTATKTPKKSKDNALVINSDNEGPGSNRATKYGDFRLGDRFKEIKKLRYNHRLGVVYAIVEWMPRDDGFVPMTSKINLEHLKANIPNETINFLVNTLIEIQTRKKNEKNGEIAQFENVDIVNGE